jgi:hypothetical protein
MQQQFSEDEEDREPYEEEEDGSLQATIQELREGLRKLLQHPQARILLLSLGGILLAIAIQSGLLVPFLFFLAIGGIVLLKRHQQAMIASTEQEERLTAAQAQREHLAQMRTMNDIQLLTSSQFEELVGSVMEQQGYTQVKVVGRSRDLCVDITAIGFRGEQVAIQCKRYSASSKIGSSAMQQFIGMIYQHHRAARGIYVTTSSYTKEARQLAEKNNIELIDGESLVKIIHTVAPGLV